MLCPIIRVLKVAPREKCAIYGYDWARGPRISLITKPKEKLALRGCLG